MATTIELRDDGAGDYTSLNAAEMGEQRDLTKGDGEASSVWFDAASSPDDTTSHDGE